MWLLLLALGGFYFVLRSIYRLYFHGLCHIPGPKLAAITHGYEFYYDVIRHGMYIWEIEKMHQQYGKKLGDEQNGIALKVSTGPVVRINPRELHIKDPYYYDQIYAPSSRRRDKDPMFVNSTGFSKSVITTIDHDLHRFRLGLMSNFFSKRSVLELRPVLHAKGSKLMQRFEKAHQDDIVLQLDDAFAAFTADLISEYLWGVSTQFLDDQNFNNRFRQAVFELSALSHVHKFFPILATVSRTMPRWLLGRLKPGATAVLDIQDIVALQSTAQKTIAKSSRKTIFDSLNDPNVPPEERSPRRLQDEGLVIFLAGFESTARVLTLSAFYLYQNKPLILKLREELRPVMPTPISEASLTQLEQLPYLTGVVNEAIRLSHGPLSRFQRVAPTESLSYKNLVIPPGSPVSMINYFVLMDPEVFPDPESFKPERWIHAAKQGQNLTKFLVAFSRGSRSCVGINLAYAELYIAIASFVRRFDMEICETTMDDILTVRELVVGCPKNGKLAVRAKVTNVIKE